MSDSTSPSAQEQQFLDAVQQALETQSFERLILSQYKGEMQQLEKMTFRLIELQQQPVLNVLYRHKTQDVTKNYPISDAMQIIAEHLACCKQGNLFASTQDVQLKRNKKKDLLTITQKTATAKNEARAAQAHDRSKHRFVEQESVFLKHLGITDAQGQIIPSMARKWKQINKFVEIFSGALTQLPNQDQALHVVDFGSGKGYLTFALYDYLAKQQVPFVTGVELNEKMVQFCQHVAEASGFNQLDFFQGDVRTYQPERLDVMIALHACDVATDFAIHTGIRLNAQMIMCAPCCHKELRPQLKSPEVLKPMLHFGIHAGQQAEMLTDTIRALLLKAYGYETKVFEFVALEHTSKNKMILATKRADFVAPDATVLAQIEALKNMYGIQKHSLELLLNNQWDQRDLGAKC